MKYRYNGYIITLKRPRKIELKKGSKMNLKLENLRRKR